MPQIRDRMGKIRDRRRDCHGFPAPFGGNSLGSPSRRHTGQRARLRPGKYKLPDVCIVRGPRPSTPIFEQPPLVAIEILSPEDRPLRVDQTIAEWLEFGVAFVRVVDPETLESILHSARGRVPVSDATVRIPETPIEIPLRRLEDE